MIDIKELDLKQLVLLQENIAQEVKLREQEKFRKLTQNAADALNALRDAFPNVCFLIKGEDFDSCVIDDCGDFEANLFDCVDKFEARHFCR